MKVHIVPFFRGEDKGEGGIRRVVEAQTRYLPQLGIEVVERDEADLVASHASHDPRVPPGTPWVVHCHGLYWSEYNWQGWCYRTNTQVARAMHMADAVTAPSEWVAQVIRRGTWLRPYVIGHGIDPEEWRPSDTVGDYVLWNKTRVDPVCDPEPLNVLAQTMRGQSFVSTFGNEAPNVLLTGTQPYPIAKRAVEQAAVYLCTTRETFGIGTIEAMACGVPVVGWAWEGQREIVTHGVNGWLVTPGDVRGLREGVEWALEHRDEAGQAAREAVLERWTWEKIMPLYEQVYYDAAERMGMYQENPRVSVVIPCHNLGRYLKDTVESLISQEDQDWEAVIVNDASTDDSASVAASLAVEYRDRSIRLINLPRNQYLAGALNAGVAASCGRYVVPLDADNMLAPGALRTLADALDASREVDIAYGGVRFVQEDGETPDRSVGIGGVSGWPPSQFNLQWQLLQRNQIPSTSMYRRAVWERTCGYRRRWRTSEDADFWTRATSLGFVPAKITDRPHLVYRQRQDSMSRTNRIPNYASWYPWAQRPDLLPWATPMKAPDAVNKGMGWNVPTHEPPRVAVVIAVGPGHEEMVIDAIDSVQAQTYQRWECIVVNDTGKDLERIPSWALIVGTEGRTGPAHARNVGIATSGARYFVPLDADDILQPNALETMLAAAEGCPDTVIYSQWWEDFGDEGTKLYDPSEYAANDLLRKGCIFAVTALYERKMWEEIGGFDEVLSHWEDWDFQIRLAVAGYCAAKIERPLFTYRKRTGQRREHNYANIDQGKQAILDRWADLWAGRRRFMPCRGCGGRAPAPRVSAATLQQGSRLMTTQGMVQIEYLDTKPGAITFRGAVTGQRQHFSPTEPVKFVSEQDVDGYLSKVKSDRSPLFRLYVEAAPSAVDMAQQDAPPLVAAGPPQGYTQDQPQGDVHSTMEAMADEPLVGSIDSYEILSYPIEQAGKLETPEEIEVIARSQEMYQEDAPSTINNYSVRQLEQVVEKLDEEEIALYLSQERAGQGRKSIIEMLERELGKRRA